MKQLHIVPRSPAPAELETVAALELAFARLHKAAFGTATGVAGALLLAGLTIVALTTERGRAFPLELLREYLSGYRVSWPGVMIGALWGFAVGFVAGWFVAFVRNISLATAAFLIQTRAELTQTRDFLDHI